MAFFRSKMRSTHLKVCRLEKHAGGGDFRCAQPRGLAQKCLFAYALL